VAAVPRRVERLGRGTGGEASFSKLFAIMFSPQMIACSTGYAPAAWRKVNGSRIATPGCATIRGAVPHPRWLRTLSSSNADHRRFTRLLGAEADNRHELPVEIPKPIWSKPFYGPQDSRGIYQE
jgi:hypothetical protein